MRSYKVTWYDRDGYYTRYFLHESDAMQLKKKLINTEGVFKIQVRRDEPVILEPVSNDDFLKELFR